MEKRTYRVSSSGPLKNQGACNMLTTFYLHTN